jgi:putative ABC transport system permease protein
MFKVALKNILGHKLRTIFTAFAIALGVAFMAGTFVLTDTVSDSFNTIFTEAYEGIDAQVRGEAAFEAEGLDGTGVRPDLDPALVDQVRGIDGVAIAEPVITSLGSVLDDDGSPLNPNGAPSIGANWTGVPEIDVFRIVEGEAPEGPTDVVVDKRTADLGDFQVGDTIGVQTLKGAVELDLVGIVTFGDSGNLGGASFTMMETQAALDTFTLDGKIQGIAVIGDEGLTQQQVVDAIEPELPDGTEVITSDVLVEENEDAIGSFVDTFRIFLTVFALIALAAGAFLIYNTYGIVIGQRIRELALLRALGAARTQVLGSVVVEAAVTGLVASVLGLLGGIGLAIVLQSLMAALGFGETDVTPVVSPRTVIVSLAVGVLVSVLCAVAPAWRASRVAPLAALRESSGESGKRSPVRLAIGGLILVAGIALLVSGSQGSGTSGLTRVGIGAVLVFAGAVALGPLLVPGLAAILGAIGSFVTRPFRSFDVPGSLARDNTRRNPKRSAGTAAALMLSVTLITLIAVVTQSFGKSINAAVDEQLKADLEVIGGGFGFPSLSPQLVDTLAETPGVAAVSGVQFGSIEIDGDPRTVFGLRLSDVPEVYDLGETEGDIAALGPDEVAVARQTADDQGWSRGDQIDVTYPDGSSATLTVGAIFEDGSIVAQDAGGEIFVDESIFREHFPGTGQLVQRINVTGEDDVDLETLKAAVEDATSSFPAAEVRDKEEIKEVNNQQLNTSLVLFFALLGLALVIGALGVAITLALSVFERTREVGLLRAVGATRAQMAVSITFEAIILTLIGTLLGLVIGTAGGTALMLAQSDEFRTLRIYVSPMFILAVLVMAAVIGVAASIIPGIRAARMNVLDAVTVE